MKNVEMYNEKYFEYQYSRMQMRDTIAGSNKVKRKGELYLPMPSSWKELDIKAASYTSGDKHGLVAADVPFHHNNPAYKAYLQRARFPDITANGLRGMMGVASKVPPSIELPNGIEYLEAQVNSAGETLEDFYNYILSELMSVGNVNIVVDFDQTTRQFYMTTYTAETTCDWSIEQVQGALDIHEISFLEGMEGEHEIIKKYQFNDALNVEIQKYKDGEKDGLPIEISYVGKPYKQIPVFPAGTIENTPDPQPIPLLGISDIALEIYQENADLRQAHFMTCNPTLFIFGAKESEKPSVLGSQVVVMLQNPQARAEYPATDTSALDHIKGYIQERYQEAASYGANILVSGAKESGEALSIRQANRGVNLVQCAKNAGRAIEDALKFIAELSGYDKEKVMFKPSTEFAEMILNSQDITALVNGWLQGIWDRDTVLDNMRAAGYISHRISNEEIKNRVENEPPFIDDGEGTEE